MAVTFTPEQRAAISQGAAGRTIAELAYSEGPPETGGGYWNLRLDDGTEFQFRFMAELRRDRDELVAALAEACDDVDDLQLSYHQEHHANLTPVAACDEQSCQGVVADQADRRALLARLKAG